MTKNISFYIPTHYTLCIPNLSGEFISTRLIIILVINKWNHLKASSRWLEANRSSKEISSERMKKDSIKSKFSLEKKREKNLSKRKISLSKKRRERKVSLRKMRERKVRQELSRYTRSFFKEKTIWKFIGGAIARNGSMVPVAWLDDHQFQCS